MPDTRVQGKNCVFAIKIGSDYYPAFCAKTMELVVNQDELETTNVNSGVSREYIPGMSNAIVSATGVHLIDNSEDKVSVNYLMQEANRRTIFEMRVLQTDNDGNVLSIEFSAFATSLSLSKQSGAHTNSTATFRITGAYTFNEIIPGPGICAEPVAIYDVLAAAENSYYNSDLDDPDVEVLEVARSGMVYTQVPGTTPGALEFGFDSGTIYFQYAGNPGGEPIYILYQVNT